MTDLAFPGTGVMGLPMARDQARPLQSEGVQLFGEPAAAAAGPLMVTMLADADAVLKLAAAVLSAVDPPDTWIQMSTLGRARPPRAR
jgi:3-hydroxyisobutyrate dehydrogenase-like beta-hydroxyacid dehydrogenase